MLSQPALVSLGRVSYGVYLFHWPVFVLLRGRGWDLTEPVRLVIALAIVLVLAVGSYELVERQVRAASWRPRITLLGAAIASALVLAVGAVIAVPARSVSATPAAGVLQPATSVAPLAGVTPTTPSRPVRILVIGDSTSESLRVGLTRWAATVPDEARVAGAWQPGGSFLLDGTIDSGGLRETQAGARTLLENDVPRLVAELEPDVVVLMSTISDVTDRTFDASEGRITPLDARYRARLLAAYRDITDRVLELGVPHVAWVVPPVPIEVLAARELNEPARYAVQHDVIAEVVAASDGTHVSSLDLDAQLAALGHTGRDWRPDGVHLSDDAATTVASRWAGPELVARALATPPTR